MGRNQLLVVWALFVPACTPPSSSPERESGAASTRPGLPDDAATPTSNAAPANDGALPIEVPDAVTNMAAYLDARQAVLAQLQQQALVVDRLRAVANDAVIVLDGTAVLSSVEPGAAFGYQVVTRWTIQVDSVRVNRTTGPAPSPLLIVIPGGTLDGQSYGGSHLPVLHLGKQHLIFLRNDHLPIAITPPVLAILSRENDGTWTAGEQVVSDADVMTVLSEMTQ